MLEWPGMRSWLFRALLALALLSCLPWKAAQAEAPGTAVASITAVDANNFPRMFAYVSVTGSYTIPLMKKLGYETFLKPEQLSPIITSFRYPAQGFDFEGFYKTLSAQGFELVGGRLLPGEAGPVAQFMYQDARGQRLTLYVQREAKEGGETAFRYARENGIGVFYWLDGHFGYALSGQMEKPDLLRIATAVYQQLNP